MKDKELIEEMAKEIAKKDCYFYDKCNRKPKHNCISLDPKIRLDSDKNYVTIATWLVNAGYRKCKDKVVLSKEEYEEYQSFKNGDYCATKCDIHELSFNQMNKISDLENENEKLKKEIKNPNEVLEDRERFRARNEELKKQLENKGKETAEKIYKDIRLFLDDKTLAIITRYFKEIVGVEIKE